MKVFDTSKKHPVTLTFLLDKDVSPQELAQKIAARCGGYDLWPGEAIRIDPSKIACVITDETLSLPAFSYQWRRSLKRSKRSKKSRKTVTGNDRSKRGGNVARTPPKGRRAKRNAAAFAK